MDNVKITINDIGLTPILIYLPGIHGDASLGKEFRKFIAGKICFVEIEYPPNENWELDDYANSIISALNLIGIKECWLLAESFGSQVSFAIASKNCDIKFNGIILAGGFVRHPFIIGVRIVKWITKLMPMCLVKLWLKVYVAVCKIFFKRERKDKKIIKDFARNRIDDADRRAIVKRYELIIKNDLRPIAKETKIPIYFLAGRWDVIVPWRPVLNWLKKNCPAFKDYKILNGADHPVIANAPETSAKQILDWLGVK